MRQKSRSTLVCGPSTSTNSIPVHAPLSPTLSLLQILRALKCACMHPSKPVPCPPAPTPYTPQGHPWATPQVAHTRRRAGPRRTDRPSRLRKFGWGIQNSQDAEVVQMGRREQGGRHTNCHGLLTPRSQARAGAIWNGFGGLLPL